MPAKAKTEVAPRDPREIAILETVAETIAHIPESGGSGIGMLGDVLTKTSAADLIGDDDSELDNLEALYGQDIRVDSLSRNTSDYDEPGQITDQYLIVNGIVVDTGEVVTFGVGAAMPIVKLAKLYGFGALPAVVRFQPSKKKTANGYYPLNMSVLAVSESRTVDA